jgi:hypothetical protein
MGEIVILSNSAYKEGDRNHRSNCLATHVAPAWSQYQINLSLWLSTNNIIFLHAEQSHHRER